MRAQHGEHRIVQDHRSRDRVRVDRVHSDAILAQLQRQGVGQRGQPVLGRRVVTVARGGLDPARRADDDDRPAVAGLDHRWDDRPQGAPGAGEVDVDDGVPLLVGQFPQPTPAQHAGVGDQDVHPTELLDPVGDQSAHRSVVTDVHGAGQRLAALGLDQSHRLGEVLLGGAHIRDGVGDRRTDIADDDVGAVPGQSHRVGAALAAGGPRHERHTSGQCTFGHRPVLSPTPRSG